MNKNKKLANDIRNFLIKNKLAIDVRIYFDNMCYAWDNGAYYNDNPKIIDDIKGSTYFEYANDKTVSMSFEGALYHVLNGNGNRDLKEKFNKIFDKYNCYYEFGYAWSLSVYFE